MCQYHIKIIYTDRQDQDKTRNFDIKNKTKLRSNVEAMDYPMF